YLSRRLTARHRELGTRWHRLPADRQALLVPALFAPGPAAAVRAVARKAFVIPDQTPSPNGRTAADRSYHSGKYKKDRMNTQVTADPFAIAAGP
ncbi:IS5/IS1182 family transposase, partial [Streptomyces sp. NPDC048281]